MRRLPILLFFILTVLTNPAVRAVAAPPENFHSSVIVSEGLNSPTAFELAPDGRIFITELTGAIRVYKNGALIPEKFAELPALAENDRGLLGLTIDPDFSANHYLYAYYIDRNDQFHKIVRFTAAGDTGTDQTLIYSSNSVAAFLHAGGGLDFGPDGKLYLAMGDSGPSANAQDLSVPNGKVLRMNRDGTPVSDNPFFGMPDRSPYIWAYGFRNPFRMQFDPQGALYLGDVGYMAWEEINVVGKGNNYGWPATEGACSGCPYVNPVYQYATSGGGSVIVGPTYRGTAFPAEYRGKLFFGDFVKGFIKTLDTGSGATSDFDAGAGSVIDIKQGTDGALYFLTIYPGTLNKISYSPGNQPPDSRFSSDVTAGNVPLTVRFSAESADPENDPLTYGWDFGDGTSSTEPNPVKTYETAGTYTVTLTTRDALHESDSAPAQIRAGIAPEIVIDSPATDIRYRGGDVIAYAARAADAAGNSLTGTSVTREVIFHHNTHIHPFLPAEPVTTGTFEIPRDGEADPDQWYEIKFRATDLQGLTAERSVILRPTLTEFTLQTEPPGMVLTVNGNPVTAPVTRTGVAGSRRDIAAAHQTVGGTPYAFAGWSDGGASGHTVTLTDNPQTFTATFVSEDIPVPSAGPYRAEYFGNTGLSGEPMITRQEDSIDYAWNEGSPGGSVPADQFSVRWTRTFAAESGIYQFIVTADDGVRLMIDGKPVIDKWHDQSARTYYHDHYLPAGDHTVTMEYYEAYGGAVAKLTYDRLPDTYEARYYGNTNLSGVPILTVADPDVNLLIGEDPPAPGIPADGFSVRWSKKQYVEHTGWYTYTIRADDGIRLKIDGQTIMNDWTDHPMRTYTPAVYLKQGIHFFQIEYYENGGNAVAEFRQTP